MAIGVDFFFVISGFLLFLPTVTNQGKPGSAKAYALRRFARIAPAYYVSLVVVIALNPFLTLIRTQMPQNSTRGVFALAAHLSFLHHEVFASTLQQGFGANPVVWTLSIEAIFYLILPFVASRYFRHPFLGLAIAMAGGFAWKLAATHVRFSLAWMGARRWKDVTIPQFWLATQFPSVMGHFALGMTAAWIFVMLRNSRLFPQITKWAPLVQIGSAILLLYAMYSAGLIELAGKVGPWDRMTKTTGKAALFAVLLTSTVLSPNWAQWPLANPIARWLGKISYGVYLYHLLLIGLALTTLGFAPGGVLKLLAFVLPLSILAGWLSYALIEKPVLRMARAWSARLEAGVPAPPSPAAFLHASHSASQVEANLREPEPALAVDH